MWKSPSSSSSRSTASRKRGGASTIACRVDFAEPDHAAERDRCSRLHRSGADDVCVRPAGGQVVAHAVDRRSVVDDARRVHGGYSAVADLRHRHWLEAGDPRQCDHAGAERDARRVENPKSVGQPHTRVTSIETISSVRMLLATVTPTCATGQMRSFAYHASSESLPRWKQQHLLPALRAGEPS